MLARINAHPRDQNIRFVEEGHKYFLTRDDGTIINPISTTTLIHHYFPSFNDDLVLDKMFKSGKLAPKYQGMTKEEIKTMWKNNGKQSSELGTIMHADIEFFFNEEPIVKPDAIEYKYFHNFWRDFCAKYPGCKPYRTEWLVYDEDVNVSGSIDFTLDVGDGRVILMDWKRSKEIKFQNRFEKGYPPFEKLDNCNYNHYTLQLNIYRHFLETKYNLDVIFMMLVILHPDNPDYVCITVPHYNIKDIWTSLTDIEPTEH